MYSGCCADWQYWSLQPLHWLRQSLQNESPQPPHDSWHSSQSELSHSVQTYRSSGSTREPQSAQDSANQRPPATIALQR
jgi:hypothetical protein